MRVPWTGKRSNQSILKEINPEYSLEGLMRKLHYFGHLMQRADSLEKTLMLGKVEGRKRRGQHYELNGHDFEQTLGDGKGQGSLVCCSCWGYKELDMPERLHNTEKVHCLSWNSSFLPLPCMRAPAWPTGLCPWVPASQAAEQLSPRNGPGAHPPRGRHPTRKSFIFTFDQPVNLLTSSFRSPDFIA